MIASSPAQHNLPLRPGLTVHPLWDNPGRQGSSINGYIRNEQGQTVAVIRQYKEQSFLSGLRELKHLETAGVSVAKHLPFVGPDNQEYLLVEYVEGSALSKEEHPALRHTLAEKICRYTTAAIQADREPLIDIGSPLQYVLRCDTPVLVDLDMFQLRLTAPDNERHSMAAIAYNELVHEDGLVIPDYSTDMADIFRPLRDIAPST